MILVVPLASQHEHQRVGRFGDIGFEAGSDAVGRLSEFRHQQCVEVMLTTFFDGQFLVIEGGDGFLAEVFHAEEGGQLLAIAEAVFFPCFGHSYQT